MNTDDIIKENQRIDREVFGETDMDNAGNIKTNSNDVVDELQQIKVTVENLKDLADGIKEELQGTHSPFERLGDVKDTVDDIKDVANDVKEELEKLNEVVSGHEVGKLKDEVINLKDIVVEISEGLEELNKTVGENIRNGSVEDTIKIDINKELKKIEEKISTQTLYLGQLKSRVVGYLLAILVVLILILFKFN